LPGHTNLNPPAPAYRQAGSSCSGEIDQSSFYISADQLNANSISDIKIFEPLYQLSFHRRLG
jgi:hypothetical protein